MRQRFVAISLALLAVAFWFTSTQLSGDESTIVEAPVVEAPPSPVADDLGGGTATQPSTSEDTATAPLAEAQSADELSGSIGLATEPANSARPQTNIPVYDTAWQMLVLASPAEADQYFQTLDAYGFTGAWAGVIHHAPATYAHPFRGGGTVATRDEQGNVVLTNEYVAHVNQILDAAQRHGQKVGLVVAWQNLYLPGGGSDAGNPTSDLVRGTVDANNSYAYGVQMVEAFGSHPAVSMWVFGGDAGTNNTEANIQVWRNMAAGVRDAGSTLDITYHTPTSHFDQLNYAGEPWLDFISPETGHSQDEFETEAELRAVADAYRLPVWQGESRYFNINFDWVTEAFRNPGVAEVEADAIAARNAGVAGYVYGDAGRWNWCGGFGDSTPCDASNIAASFGAGEAAVINVFTDAAPIATPEPTTPAPAPAEQSRVEFEVDGQGVGGTATVAVLVDGVEVGLVFFGETRSTQSIKIPSDTAWADVELMHLDQAGVDLTLFSMSWRNETRQMVGGQVLVSGQWTGAECSPLGDPLGANIECTGVVSFPATVTPAAVPQPVQAPTQTQAPAVAPSVSFTSPTTMRPSVVTIVGGFAGGGTEPGTDGAGILGVAVSVVRSDVSPNLVWDGASWVPDIAPVNVPAAIDGSGAWALPGVDLTQPGVYQFTAQALDANSLAAATTGQTITVVAN